MCRNRQDNVSPKSLQNSSTRVACVLADHRQAGVAKKAMGRLSRPASSVHGVALLQRTCSAHTFTEPRIHLIVQQRRRPHQPVSLAAFSHLAHTQHLPPSVPLIICEEALSPGASNFLSSHSTSSSLFASLSAWVNMFLLMCACVYAAAFVWLHGIRT